MRRALLTLVATAGLVAGLTVPAAAQSPPAAPCAAPKTVVTTAVGIRYCVDPAFDQTVAAQVQKIRGDIRAQRQAGKLVIYASTPISPRGGGDEAVNLEVAASVKSRPGTTAPDATSTAHFGPGDMRVLWMWPRRRHRLPGALARRAAHTHGCGTSPIAPSGGRLRALLHVRPAPSARAPTTSGTSS
jgi:hypothetical protein